MIELARTEGPANRFLVRRLEVNTHGGAKLAATRQRDAEATRHDRIAVRVPGAQEIRPTVLARAEYE